jgi:hypothetical protein
MRLVLFWDWIKNVPELHYLLKEEYVHSFFALLQHYGVPTHYLDFTINPKVAGFFAGTGQGAVPGRNGCIIAISPDDWVETLRAVAQVKKWPPENWPEKVVVNFPNLWRMQAQSGHFVYLPLEKAEAYFPPDRIIFPHNEQGIELTISEVYPLRKSQLEERLDEFFTEELIRSNQAYRRQMLTVWESAGRYWEIPFTRPDPRQWLRPGANDHESWESAVQGWSVYLEEGYHQARDGTMVEICINPDDHVRERDQLLASLSNFLQNTPESRGKAVEWKVHSSRMGTPPGWIAFVERAAGRTWDGVRRLPYSDSQVVDAVVMTVLLACAKVVESPSFRAEDFSPLLGSLLHIELANARNLTARCAMAKCTYHSVIREDMHEVLLPERREFPLEDLLKVLTPRQLFDFPLLVNAFARELVPTQVLMQRNDLAVFFSPAQTEIIGVP